MTASMGKATGDVRDSTMVEAARTRRSRSVLRGAPDRQCAPDLAVLGVAWLDPCRFLPKAP